MPSAAERIPASAHSQPERAGGTKTKEEVGQLYSLSEKKKERLKTFKGDMVKAFSAIVGGPEGITKFNDTEIDRAIEQARKQVEDHIVARMQKLKVKMDAARAAHLDQELKGVAFLLKSIVKRHREKLLIAEAPVETNIPNRITDLHRLSDLSGVDDEIQASVQEGIAKEMKAKEEAKWQSQLTDRLTSDMHALVETLHEGDPDAELTAEEIFKQGRSMAQRKLEGAFLQGIVDALPSRNPKEMQKILQERAFPNQLDEQNAPLINIVPMILVEKKRKGAGPLEAFTPQLELIKYDKDIQLGFEFTLEHPTESLPAIPVLMAAARPELLEHEKEVRLLQEKLLDGKMGARKPRMSDPNYLAAVESNLKGSVAQMLEIMNELMADKKFLSVWNAVGQRQLAIEAAWDEAFAVIYDREVSGGGSTRRSYTGRR